MTNFDPSIDPRVQEALSRKYSNDVVILLPLRGGQVAVFNNARELCGITEDNKWIYRPGYTPECQSPSDQIWKLWHPPTTIEPAPTPKATLDDLELL